MCAGGDSEKMEVLVERIEALMSESLWVFYDEVHVLICER